MNVTDGLINQDLIIWERGRQQIDVGCGLALTSPALAIAPASYLVQLENEVRAQLQNLGSDERLQIRWSQNGDFSRPLKSYYDQTEALADSEWGRYQRNAKYVLNSELQEAGKLRCEKARLFLIKKGVPLLWRDRSDPGSVVEAVAQSFQLYQRSTKEMMKRLGGGVEKLSNARLFEECYLHLNPFEQSPSSNFFESQFRPDRSILENCLLGDLAMVPGHPYCFYNGGCFQSYLALSAPPMNTFSGVIAQLTSLPERDFSIIVNIEALDVTKEIEKAERELTKLRRAVRSHPKASMLQEIEEAENRVRRLTSREQHPMKAQVLLHVWARSAEELQHKIAGLRVGCQLMQGAKGYEVALPTMNRDLHFAAMPGASFREPSFWLKLGDHNVANLVPLVGDSVESLEGAHAFYHGWQGNLTGVKIFKGSGGSESPQLAFVTGKSGGGKSAFLVDLLTQTSPHVDFGVTIDDGDSHGALLQVMTNRACRTFTIDVNGGESLNYFDTGRLPLSAFHYAGAIGVAMQMAGVPREDEARNRRQAVLSRVMRSFFHSRFEEWKKNNPGLVPQLVQTLAEARIYRRLFEPGKAFGDIWSDFSEWRQSDSGQQSAKSEEVRQEVQAIEQDLSCEDLVNLSYSFLTREDAPVHSEFHDYLEKYQKETEQDQDELQMLVTLLEPWRADRGTRGCLFDGPNTVDFSAKYVHIELGRMQDADPTLKALVSLVISSTIRNEIMRRPRSQKKQLVIEELGSFLTIKGGKELVQDMYQRMRKHNCWVVSVIQQLSSLPEDLARTVIGNCRQAYLFRQKEEGDLRALQRAFDLPDSIVELMKQFPEPSAERGAPFIFWEDLGNRSRAIPCFNLVSPEMLYVAGTGGSQHEKRKRALQEYDSVFEGVMAEVTKENQGQ
ncbi:hypothetical protein N9062_00340 [Akkermansiaceae bacterium]|jgi:hypothetical protein|nr:hypothetical protein [Akkermansiaceae bacterium]MDB4509425.1 hypothetical protein [Akkermansiaceae bacterium]